MLNKRFFAQNACTKRVDIFIKHKAERSGVRSDAAFARRVTQATERDMSIPVRGGLPETNVYVAKTRFSVYSPRTEAYEKCSKITKLNRGLGVFGHPLGIPFFKCVFFKWLFELFNSKKTSHVTVALRLIAIVRMF